MTTNNAKSELRIMFDQDREGFVKVWESNLADVLDELHYRRAVGMQLHDYLKSQDQNNLTWQVLDYRWRLEQAKLDEPFVDCQ